MPTLPRVNRPTAFAILTVTLLGASGALARPADAPDSLHMQLMAMSGAGLMLSGCQERLQALDGMLSRAGYGPMHSKLVDGTMIARWYQPESHATVLAFAGWQGSGNAFSAGDFTGLMRWNELVTGP